MSDIIDHEDSSEGDLDVWTEETVDIQTPFSNLIQTDSEYLKLEVAELKQLLISLAEKYKLSEDKRKVAVKRNAILKADNERLQQMADISLNQKIEAEIENKRTLDKLREFIDFKTDFEKQADLLKKIIGHLPKMKNASTTTRVPVDEKSEQCCINNNYEDNDEIVNVEIENHQEDDIMQLMNCSGDNNESKALNDAIKTNIELDIDDQNYWISNINVKNSENMMKDVEMEHKEYSWDCNKFKKELSSDDSNACLHAKNRLYKSKVNVAKLKQEILALKNLNEWKTSDLDFKNRQLIVKNRELLFAKKEMTHLKMKISKLMVEQQKRPVSSASSIKPSMLPTKPEKRSKESINKKDSRSNDHSKRKNDAKSNETNTLPVSNESVWAEIAPGDQVRIKMKKQTINEI